MRFILGMLALLVCISLINSLFNQLGDTLLFTYCGSRRFTLEALLYGAATGGMFLSVLIWFASYNIVMTSDKFIYLFGWCIPAVSLLLSMVLRLVPSFKRQAATIAEARKCVGKAPTNGKKKTRLQNSMDVLSVLTSWALEGAVITADSMKSRGYGSGPRSNFSIYKLTKRDLTALGVMLAAFVLTVAGAILGGADSTYYPAVTIQTGIYTVMSAAGYLLFLMLPSVIQIWEEAIWHISRSRI